MSTDTGPVAIVGLDQPPDRESGRPPSVNRLADWDRALLARLIERLDAAGEVQHTVACGDVLSIHGRTGEVFAGSLPVVEVDN